MDNATLFNSRIRSAASLGDRMVTDDARQLEATDSAIRAITDFELDFPITVDMEAPMEDAFRDMGRLGVHALLVTHEGPDGIDPQVFGLVTAHEIARTRSRLDSKAIAGRRRQSPKVRDVMTPWNELSMVKYESLQSLTALELYEMFQGTGLTHLLVIEVDARNDAVARGVLSRANLAKRLRGAGAGAGHNGRYFVAEWFDEKFLMIP